MRTIAGKFVLLLGLGLALNLSSSAQSYKAQPEGGVYLDTVVNVQLNQQQIYSNAIDWINSSFANAKAAIQSKQPETGEIVFKGTFLGSYPDSVGKPGKQKETLINAAGRFTGKVIAKDGKFRLMFTELEASSFREFYYGVKPPAPGLNYGQNNWFTRQIMPIFSQALTSIGKKPDTDF